MNKIVWLTNSKSCYRACCCYSCCVVVCEGIIESDDVSSLSLEIEKALNYCKKCNVLVESVKRKDSLVCVRVVFDLLIE